MPDQTIYQKPRRAGRAGETVVTSTCGHNCGGRCVVNAHVVEDRIVKISTDPAPWQPELPPLHACARGVGQIERVYHPDRLKYPMRRARGSTLLPVKVTGRIASGVVSIKEDAWPTPDSEGADTTGCANALTDDRSAPCGATTYNANLVEVERAV